MKYELGVWGFIVKRYVAISTHNTKEEAMEALKAKKAEREAAGTYTDMGTFKIGPVGWQNFSLRQLQEHGL